jgi:methionyl-tRNA formyltransferase
VSLRIVALGTSQMLASCCEAWRARHAVVGIISMPEETRPQNSADLRSFADSTDSPYFEFADINSADALQALDDLKPDIIFSMWPKLLRAPAIATAKIGCIGTHWTELPANRGRHPLHWTIALGLDRGAISFFKMDSKVDSGDILLQIPFGLSGSDTVVDGLAKLCAAAVEGCVQLSKRLADKPALDGIPQDKSKANYWRGRTVHDTIIDFRMSRLAIDRLVRSYCAPFPGAKILYRDALVPVDRTLIDPSDRRGPNLEPGRILLTDDVSLTVKADDGPIRLFVRDAADLAHLRAGECILPPTGYALKL